MQGLETVFATYGCGCFRYGFETVPCPRKRSFRLNHHGEDGGRRSTDDFRGRLPSGPRLRHNLPMAAVRGLTALIGLTLCAAPHAARAQETKVAVPEWALPGSATHAQVAPPADFHRPSTNFDIPLGIFQGQSDIGSALVPGAASYDSAKGEYTIRSAGYNIWYTRDEFRYLWKKMSGDVSLAADIAYPDPEGYGDRKAVLVIRQNLEDDSKEAIVALHGAGMIHLAERPERGVRVKDMEYRIGGRGIPGGKTPDSLVNVMAKRIGIEKKGDSFALFVSMEGEAMHQFGPAIRLHLDEPFYAGIGFCSHLPDKSDTAVLSNVVLENAAGRVR